MCAPVCACICVHVCTCACMYVYACVHMFACVSLCTCVPVCMCVHVYLCASVCACIHVHVYACVCTSVYLCACVPVCVYEYTVCRYVLCVHAHIRVHVFLSHCPSSAPLRSQAPSYHTGDIPRHFRGGLATPPAFLLGFVLSPSFTTSLLLLFSPILPGFPSQASFSARVCISLFILFYFFLLTETRARPSSPFQDLLQTSRWSFMAVDVLVIVRFLWVLINPAALGSS